MSYVKRSGKRSHASKLETQRRKSARAVKYAGSAR